MIGLDTNVLLRIFVEDDPPSQHRRAVSLMRDIAPERALVNAVVLVEATWTLARRMKRTRAQVSAFVADLLDAEVFEIACAEPARRALAAYAEGKADYADYLIAELNGEAGCRTTFTFEKDAALHPSYSILP